MSLGQAQQNHRMVAVGRDLSRSAYPTLAQGSLNYSRFPRAVSHFVLGISKDGHFANSVGNMFQYSTMLSVKRGEKKTCFNLFKLNFLYFTLCPSPLCPVTRHY